MPSLSSLLAELPEIKQSRMVSSGLGVWMAWSGKKHNAIENTMRDYGALLMTEDNNQALWFCPDNEVLRAVARLQNWARVNSLPAFCQVFPVTFLVAPDLSISLSVPQEIKVQDVVAPSDFEVWLHPKLKEQVASVKGLAVRPANAMDGLAPLEWNTLHADSGLDYESMLKWYFIIKPLGKLGDKESIIGWRDFSAEIQDLLQRLGLRYISDVKEGFIFFPLNNIRLLRTFCSDVLNTIAAAKADEEKKYWPVVMAAVPQQGHNFTEELPKKVGVDWNRLVPDFPHLRYVDAFLLSNWFKLNETRYGGAQVTLDSWCNIRLKDGGDDARYGTMEVMLPVNMVQNDGRECFYCGQKNHLPSECPTKQFTQPASQVWTQLSKLDLDALNDAVVELDKAVDPENFVATMEALLDKKKGPAALLARCIFEINSCVQLRLLKLVWRSRGKEWPEGLRQLAPEESSNAWSALAALQGGDIDEAALQAKEASLKHQRSFQPHSFMGFLSMEQEDFGQALFQWQEAERLGYTPLQQGYLEFLQGRLHEVEGAYKDAVSAYKRAYVISPMWQECLYRQAVAMVKMGFAGQAMDLFHDLIQRDPHMFNRILIDPELDRGRVQILSALWDLWYDVETRAEEARKQVDEYIEDINKRFDKKHAFYEAAAEDLDRLKKIGAIRNYVAYRQLLRGAEKFKEQLDNQVKLEVRRVNGTVEFLTERIKEIQKEAAWFPFPSLLRDFNRDFNFCVEKINWIKTQQIKQAENFRKSLDFMTQIEDHIDTLQKKLVTLRIIRDGTLFVLMLGKSFIWFELVGLGLALMAVPAFLYFTHGVEGSWIVDTIRTQQWEFTKGLVIILSVLALLFSAVKTALGFEKKKREMFEQLEEELRTVAPKRY
ncbi:tetratricopeptide repeat protein [Pseudodesulfovibrio senegalensis]|uniref:Tetratricopeptide repeat protein n=1 Tax=Pseudodesulfovibrio senegalensis TaxID=1721087 RepID=A0A6N6N8D7_9BACT|nr:tetratricopeptide repeat protein [Pseudodesulfovibrio senegalensis]KAB1443595.1 tetratricopeptide repeat protein [Pseudodesulfovibrio senegalensis]